MVWVSCILENPLDRTEIPLDPEIDSKQNYIDFIFHPGRFPVSVINKALSVNTLIFELFNLKFYGGEGEDHKLSSDRAQFFQSRDLMR